MTTDKQFTQEEIILMEKKLIETTDPAEAEALAAVLKPYFTGEDEEPEPIKAKAFEEPEEPCPVLPKDQRKRPQVKDGENGEVVFETDHRVCGVESKAVELILLVQAMHTDGRKSDSTDAARLQPVIALMDSIDPKDAIEGMMATQMIALQNMAMNCANRAAGENQTFEGRDMNLRHATRLINAFANTVSALDKHRGKGQQKITVEHQHVQVASGGQAIIGDVHHGGGENGKSE
jgi:hypothetical protein